MEQQYRDTRSGKVGHIYKADKQKGTVLFIYTDGTNTAMTRGTFNRYFVECSGFLEVETLKNIKTQNEEKEKKDGTIQCKRNRELRWTGRRRLF